jgi:hypothetical protein
MNKKNIPDMLGISKSNSHGLSNHGKEVAKKTINPFLLLAFVTPTIC